MRQTSRLPEPLETKVLLIRHGETDWNHSGRWQGHTDIPLNDTGRAQARALAKRLSSWPIRAIYSSDLQRAAQTAEILGETLGLAPTLEPALRERNGGVFEGLTASQLQASHQQALLCMREKGAAPPGGESALEVANRITGAFDTILSQHQGELLAIVSHGGALISLISHILGFPAGERAHLTVAGNTGLSVVTVDEYGSRLTLLNDTSHLEKGNLG